MRAFVYMSDRTDEEITSDSIEICLAPKSRKKKEAGNTADCTKKVLQAQHKQAAAQTVPSGKSEKGSPSLQSAHIVLPDESESEWNQLLKDWQDAYKPQNALARNLIERAASAEWFLQRALRRYNQIEQALYAAQPHVTQWESKQAGSLEKALRHRTAAERSFYQARHAVEQLRSGQSRPTGTGQVSTPFVSSPHVSEPVEPTKPKAPGAIIQCVTVQVINGKTFTLFQPRNEYFQRMIESSREPKPIVKRALYFLHGVPSEYSWVSDCENAEGNSHFTVERSCQEALGDLAREQAARSMHVLQVV